MQNKKACGSVCVFLVRCFVRNGIFWLSTLLSFPKRLLQVEWSNVYKDGASYAIYDHITPITGLLHLSLLFRCIPSSLWRVWLIGGELRLTSTLRSSFGWKKRQDWKCGWPDFLWERTKAKTLVSVVSVSYKSRCVVLFSNWYRESSKLLDDWEPPADPHLCESV